MSQSGIAFASIVIVVVVVAGTAVGAPVAIDEVDTQPDHPLYFLERIGESIKKPFADDQSWQVARANERIGEFGAMADKGKAEKYGWLIDEADDHLYNAATLSKNNTELREATEALAKHLVVLEDIKKKVPKEVKSRISRSQLCSYASMRVLENVSAEAHGEISEPLKIELENRMNEVKTMTENLRAEQIPSFKIQVKDSMQVEPEEVKLEIENASVYASTVPLIENLHINIVDVVIHPENEKPYIWENFELGSLTFGDITYETGISGKIHRPQEMKLNENYPIYLYPEYENVEIASLGLLDIGFNFCVGPGITLGVYDIHRWDLYLHVGIGVVTPLGTWWDQVKWHIPIIVHEPTRVRISAEGNLENLARDLQLGELKGPYKIEIRLEENNEPLGSIDNIVADKLAHQMTLGGGTFYQPADQLGFYVEEGYEYLVGLYQRNLDRDLETINICVGPSLVFKYKIFFIDIELLLHFGLGFGEWDWPILEHFGPLWGTSFSGVSLSSSSLSYRHPEHDWERTDWYRVKSDQINPSCEYVEYHINGELDAVAITDEVGYVGPIGMWTEPENLISISSLGPDNVYYAVNSQVKVIGKFSDKRGNETVIDNILVYYWGSKNISAGDNVKGYVKLVVLPDENPIKYFSALDEGYYVNSENEVITIGPGSFEIEMS